MKNQYFLHVLNRLVRITLIETCVQLRLISSVTNRVFVFHNIIYSSDIFSQLLFMKCSNYNTFSPIFLNDNTCLAPKGLVFFTSLSILINVIFVWQTTFYYDFLNVRNEIVIQEPITLCTNWEGAPTLHQLHSTFLRRTIGSNRIISWSFIATAM